MLLVALLLYLHLPFLLQLLLLMFFFFSFYKRSDHFMFLCCLSITPEVTVNYFRATIGTSYIVFFFSFSAQFINLDLNTASNRRSTGWILVAMQHEKSITNLKLCKKCQNANKVENANKEQNQTNWVSVCSACSYKEGKEPFLEKGECARICVISWQGSLRELIRTVTQVKFRHIEPEVQGSVPKRFVETPALHQRRLTGKDWQEPRMCAKENPAWSEFGKPLSSVIDPRPFAIVSFLFPLKAPASPATDETVVWRIRGGRAVAALIRTDGCSGVPDCAFSGQHTPARRELTGWRMWSVQNGGVMVSSLRDALPVPSHLTTRHRPLPPSPEHLWLTSMHRLNLFFAQQLLSASHVL